VHDADPSDRLWLLVAGLLLVLTPAFTLVVVYAVLITTQSVTLGQVSLVQAIELYLVELAFFAGFGYLLYRLTLYAVDRRIRTVERRDDERGQTGAHGGDRRERSRTR
jgi:membrane protein implicated in regulation of membrane protease activity